MQQSNAAATAFYDHAGGGGSFNNAGPTGGDAGDAVMARWLQSAGLQHLAFPLTSTGIDQRLLPNLLMQVNVLLIAKEQSNTDASASSFIANEKEISTRENNVAKIKVVVRKRPLNKKEISRKEDDIVTVDENALTVHEPKLKVDLTAYVEKHEFCFDAVLDEHVTNDEVYRVTVEPIIPIIFQRTKATCFAYGQTGSGKTFTMQPLPLRAAQDLIRFLHQPVYHSQGFKLWLSYFEIYGGKLFDLLSDRK
ncbi:hypothetical protein ES319_D07G037700v1 [Gossypium barbadense]|uniref:Kinesin motor domain-containing protein n=2 Tax=Gossypium TaxID=3633 RepID=A0A5J5QLS3_GOSBA|nr:hypothetical protein ES319_D07G037700v1 [Gossypium barbadense]TYG60095.1 hypothetical protein ES288_D07G040500v1 [Gossypium darwinii]